MMILVAQTTQSVASGLSAPVATVIAGCLVLTGAIVGAIVGLLNLRYQAIASRYKTYIETYKIAKEAGLTDAKDEAWAKNVLKQVEKDLRIRFRLPLALAIISLVSGLTVSALANVLGITSYATNFFVQVVLWFANVNMTIFFLATMYRDVRQLLKDIADVRERRRQSKVLEK